MRAFRTLFAGLIAAALLAPSGAAQAAYNPATGRFYRLTPYEGNYASCVAQAEQLGGKLVSVQDAAENAFLVAHFSSTTSKLSTARRGRPSGARGRPSTRRGRPSRST